VAFSTQAFLLLLLLLYAKSTISLVFLLSFVSNSYVCLVAHLCEKKKSQQNRRNKKDTAFLHFMMYINTQVSMPCHENPSFFDSNCRRMAMAEKQSWREKPYRQNIFMLIFQVHISLIILHNSYHLFGFFLGFLLICLHYISMYAICTLKRREFLIFM